MSVTVTRKGSGPALFRATGAGERARRGRTALWILLAVVLALIVAVPAFAQSSPPVPGVGDRRARTSIPMFVML